MTFYEFVFSVAMQVRFRTQHSFTLPVNVDKWLASLVATHLSSSPRSPISGWFTRMNKAAATMMRRGSSSVASSRKARSRKLQRRSVSVVVGVVFVCVCEKAGSFFLFFIGNTELSRHTHYTRCDMILLYTSKVLDSCFVENIFRISAPC